jgi:hypothetical protein
VVLLPCRGNFVFSFSLSPSVLWRGMGWAVRGDWLLVVGYGVGGSPAMEAPLACPWREGDGDPCPSPRVRGAGRPRASTPVPSFLLFSSSPQNPSLTNLATPAAFFPDPGGFWRPPPLLATRLSSSGPVLYLCHEKKHGRACTWRRRPRPWTRMRAHVCPIGSCVKSRRRRSSTCTVPDSLATGNCGARLEV